MKNAIKLLTSLTFTFIFLLTSALIKPASAFAYTYNDFLIPISPSSTIESSGFADPNNIIGQEGNFVFITKTSDTATMNIIFDTPITSDKNIYYFQPRFNYAADSGEEGVTCSYSVSTDQGTFSNTICAFPSNGYPDGLADNAFFINLPNNIHQINSFEFTISSPENPNFLLKMGSMDFFYSVTDNLRPTASTDGPYEVAKGQSIQLHSTSVDLNNDPLEYNWDLTNDGFSDSSEQNPIFSAVGLEPGVYPVRLIVDDFSPLNDKTTTTVTVKMTTEAGGPYSVNAGNSVQLNASSNDPGNETYTYAWDLDNNGSFETSGQTAEFSAASLTPGDYTVKVQATDTHGNTATDEATITVVNPNQLTALAPAKVWIGLKNSDDVGLKFDLKAEAYKDGVLISSGQLNSFTGGSSGFGNAHLATINFDSFSPVDFPSGSVLSIKVSVRNACSGSAHNSGTARLWYNDSAANSQFGSTIAENSVTDYLRDGFVLDTTTGATKKTIDVAAGAKCSAFKPFGTWTITP